MFRVYDQINDWRANEGVPAVKRDLDLEKTVQSSGFIWTHSQHPSLGAAIILCAVPQGCREDTYENFETKPVTNWIKHKDTHGHYNKATNRKYEKIGCSVNKKWIDGAYGYSIWCVLW